MCILFVNFNFNINVLVIEQLFLQGNARTPMQSAQPGPNHTARDPSPPG